jgi:hypothetical protein
MAKVSKYGDPRSTRLLKHVDKKLRQFCIEHELNESDVMQAAIECFLTNEDCLARRKSVFKE